MSELKCCPFCGGKPILLKHNDEDYYKVFCECCGARQWTFANRTDKDAIRNWNTRTPMDNIVEKLEELKEKGYAELTMLEVNELIDEAINIVKQEINNEGGLTHERNNNHNNSRDYRGAKGYA